MEECYPFAVDERDTRHIQGEPPAFGESLLTTRIQLFARVANDLTLYQHGHGTTRRLGNRYPYHQLRTLGTPFVMQVKSQFVRCLFQAPQHAEKIKDIGFFVNR